MVEFLSEPAAQVVLYSAVAAALIAIGYYLRGLILHDMRQPNDQPSDWLSRVRELHAQGVLNDEEFRNIKTKLVARLQGEWNEPEKEGE